MQLTILKNSSFQLLFKTVRKQSLLLIILIAGFGFNSFAQPANDDPCNALPLTADLVCNYQVFDNTNSTAYAGLTNPSCGVPFGGGPVNDIWFQVTVPAASNGTLTFGTQEGDITDLAMAIYTGPDCNNLTQLACSDDEGPGLMPLITQPGLTVGSIIWIRAWAYNNNQSGTFGICIKYPPPPPSYDEPCTATALPTPTFDCNYQTFTDDGATASASAPAPGCANYQGGDVWFSVVVPAAGILSFDTQTGDVTDGGMAIYSGADCNNLTLIACDDNSSTTGNMPKIVANNLTPGTTIWIRFWSNGFNANIGTFGLCVSIPPPPPVNDDPCGAIQLTPSNTCNYQTFTTESATGSAGVASPNNCGFAGGTANYQGGDVWFKVTVPCEGSLIIDTQTGVITDGGMAVYTGTCDNLTQIACDDDGSANGLMPQISLSNLAAGSTLWIRFWEYGNDNPGTFGICVSIPPPPIPGGGGNCLNAQPFCSSNTVTYSNSTNVPSLGSAGIYDCLLSTPNPTWFYMQIQNPGDLTIHIVQSNPGGYQDVDFCLWGPFPNLAASCGVLSANNVVDCSYSASNVEDANITNATVGDVYVLLLTNFSNQPGLITFGQTAGTGSTSCDIICQLTAGNSGPVCTGQTVNLTSSLVLNATYQWTGPNCFSQQVPLSQQQNPTQVTVPSTPGTYIYTVTATSTDGSLCHAVDTVIVLARPALGNDTTVYICSGTTKDLETVYDTTGLTTSWSHFPGGETVGNAGAADTSGIYQVIVTSASGCTDTALVTLVVDTVRSTATLTANATCNAQGQITISNPTGVGSAFDYSLDGTTFQPSNSFLVNAGTYAPITRDSLGCITTSAPLVVIFINDLTLAVTGDTTICFGTYTTLHANSNAATYAWTPTTGLNDPTSAAPIASPADNTTYTVTATLGSCTLTGTAIVNVDKNLFVDAGGPLFIDAGGSAQALAIVTGPNPALSNILWTPSAGLSATNILNPIVTPVIANGTTSYDITVTNLTGCTATDRLIVNVLANCRNVRNAFTPNGDGINDYWMVYDQFDCLSNVTVNVFNRYGSKIFESDNYRNTWDGHYKGKQVPDGTYYAIVEFKMLSGKTITVKTDLTILR